MLEYSLSAREIDGWKEGRKKWLGFLNANFKMLKIILISLALHEHYWIRH